MGEHLDVESIDLEALAKMEVVEDELMQVCWGGGGRGEGGGEGRRG